MIQNEGRTVYGYIVQHTGPRHPISPSIVSVNGFFYSMAHTEGRYGTVSYSRQYNWAAADQQRDFASHNIICHNSHTALLATPCHWCWQFSLL